MNRRRFVINGVGALGILPLAGHARDASTPESLQDAPWLSGQSAQHDPPTDAVAEPNTVQVVRVSPVLYSEFAAILIHNNTEDAVMLDGVRGELTVGALAGFQSEVAAYMVPNIILPPNEYWIARLKLPAELAVGTPLTFESEVRLVSKLPRPGDISTLLTALVPPGGFALPEPGAAWPIRYRNDAPYAAGRYASFQQVFFDESGAICGFSAHSVRYDDSGEAEFSMQLTSSPQTSTGGAPLGETSDRWLAQWSHQPGWTAFEGFDIGE